MSVSQPAVDAAPVYQPRAVLLVAMCLIITGGYGAWRLGLPTALPYGAMVLVAVGAAVVDARSLRLPNLCTYGLIVGGLIALLALQVTGSAVSLVAGALGGVLYGGLLLVIGLIRPQATGLGDIKLVAGLGVWLAGASVDHLLAGVIAGQLILGIWALSDLRLHGRSREIPAGPALVMGAIVGLLV